LKSGDVGSGFCFVGVIILTLIEDRDTFLCLIQDIFLFVKNQQLTYLILQYDFVFSILRNKSAVQQGYFSNHENHERLMKYEVGHG
jgi:hypothetical protein